MNLVLLPESVNDVRDEPRSKLSALVPVKTPRHYNSGFPHVWVAYIYNNLSSGDCILLECFC